MRFQRTTILKPAMVWVQLILTVGIFWACTNQKPTNTDMAGGTAQAGNALVSGHLYKTGGQAAVNAQVCFVKVNYNPYSKSFGKVEAVQDTLFTDERGYYGTSQLDSGLYNVYGKGADNTVCMVESVLVKKTAVIVQADTLRAPATLSGWVHLWGDDDPKSVFVIPMGSSEFGTTGASGDFTLTSLAEGKYTIRFMSLLDRYMSFDTTFSLAAGQNFVLGDTLHLPLRIPTPTGFNLSYDSLRRIVSLSWNFVNTPRVKGYNLYRLHAKSGLELKLNSQLLTNTVFHDSTTLQDESYRYSVVSVGNDNQEGFPLLSDTLRAVSAFRFVADIRNPVSGPGQMVQPSDVVYDPSGAFWTLDYGRNRMLKFDTNGLFLKEWAGTTSLSDNNRPAGLAFFSNALFLARWNGLSLQKYDAEGTLLFGKDSSGRMNDVSVDEGGGALCSLHANHRKYSIHP